MLLASGIPHNSRNSHCKAYSCAEWDVIHDYLGDVPCKNKFKLGASASEFCEWIQVRIDV